MGYYTDISNSEYAAKDVALYNRMQGVSNHSAAGVILSQALPSVFMTLTTKIAEKRNSNNNDKTTETTSEEQQRAELSKQLQKALGAIGAKNEQEIDAKVAEAETNRDKNIQAAQAVVDTFTNGTDEYSSQITSLKVKITGLTTGNDPDGKQKTQLESQIKDLEKAQEKAKQKAVKNLQQVTNSENANMAKVRENALEAQEIVLQLKALNSIDNKETEKVQTQYTELNSFNTAYDNYKQKPSKETALALQKALQDIPDNSPSRRNCETLYNMYRKDVEGLLK